MPERATAFEVSNWGKETTPGQAPSSGKRLGSITVRPSYELEVTPYTVVGTKFPLTASLVREASSATLEGWLDYEGIVYPLASVMHSTTPQQQGSTQAYKWTFTPNQSTADTPVTYTVQFGSSGGANQFSYGIVSELGMEFGSNTNRLTGRMIGRKIVDNATLWGSPTVVTPVPLQPKEVSVYYGVSTPNTKLDRAFAVSWTIRNRWAPVYVIDSALAGDWVTHVETVPESEFTLLVEADASNSNIWHTAAQQSNAYWLKIDAQGATIQDTYKYTLTITSKVMVVGAREFSDQDGVIAVEWTLRSVYDSTSGYAVRVEVINKQTAL
jgi:hypothetical protein